MRRRTFLEAMAGLPVRGSLLSSEDEHYLAEQARRIALSARLMPRQSPNQTPYTIRVPGGNMGYPAFWIRDAVMMLGGDLIGAEELEGWIRLIASTIPGPRDWRVRPGVVVPAFSVPDHINFDGKAVFYPGTYETGEKQGGRPFGKYPPIDDSYYFISAVWHHWRLSRSTALFVAPVKTSWGEMRLCDLCERIYATPRSDPATGLCVSLDIEDEHAIDFGFCDTIRKSGRLLFPSLLKSLAALQLADLFRDAGRSHESHRYDHEARRIRAAIPPVFLHTCSKTEAWLHSATGACNQADVWGSAFAVWSGALKAPEADRVARALVRAYRERTSVREGCVRHVLTTDPLKGGGWETGGDLGVYQNGGYWGTPAGWYLAALARVDREAARAMAAEYVRFLRDHSRPDGTSEAWEWWNPETGRKANPLYAATVVLPWISLRSASLCAQ